MNFTKKIIINVLRRIACKGYISIDDKQFQWKLQSNIFDSSQSLSMTSIKMIVHAPEKTLFLLIGLMIY